MAVGRDRPRSPEGWSFPVRARSDVPGRPLRAGVPGPTAVSVPAALAALLGVLLLPSGPLAAQETGAISGTVVDANRDAPLGLARVEIPRLDRRTLADERGRFRFGEVPAGTYSVRVEYLGFETTVREVTVLSGEVVTVEILVTPRPISLEDLEVTSLSLTWFPGFIRRKEDRTGHFFTKQEIEAADPDHLTDLLRDREGVRLGFNRHAYGARKRFPQFYYTGPAYEGGAGSGRPRLSSAFCRPVILVDGEPIGPGSPYLRFNEIPPELVLAMEVYYRAEELPESITFNDLRLTSLSREDVRRAAEMAGGRAEAIGRSTEEDVGLFQTLAGAGLENGFRRPLRSRREDERRRVQRTVFAGLYESIPRMEHCGAIFVWTRFYPLREG